MPRFQIISSFNEHGYKVYGKRFLDSYAKYVSADLPLIVMAEGFDRLFQSPAAHIEIRKLDQSELWQFVERHQHNPTCHGFVHGYKDKNGQPLGRDYRYDALRYARKVFALTDPKLDSSDIDIRIWLDADVRFHKQIDASLMAKHLNLDCVINF
ncbi:MAG: hypothetical protein AAF403_07680, partial [Pseudomonadota bacterium]